MRNYIWPLALMAFFDGFGQHQELGEQPAIWKGSPVDSIPVNSPLQAFKKGKFNGHLRYFFMSTDNQKGLTDYHAHATGGGIRFETAPFKGFQAGLSGFFIFNIGSSDLSVTDPVTKQGNRYEIGLFDLQNPGNRSDIDRLEEFFLRYNFKGARITFGKQLINTPFINLQDGRMRPTVIRGLWAEANGIPHTRLEGGWLDRVSPRGTVKWFDAGSSIGVYPAGVDSSGQRSGYAGFTRSRGIGLLGLTRALSDEWSVQLWNLYAENIFLTAMVQADMKHKVVGAGTLIAGAQLIRQWKTGDGGNLDAYKRYVQDGGSLTFGATVGWDQKPWKTSVSYNRITAKGRYLMPREWGREPFYTFMARERNEGLADAQAWVWKLDYAWPKSTFKPSLAIGYYHLPEVTNYRFNKYGMPSYTQLNADLRYDCKGVLSGLNLQLLYIYKWNASGSVPPPKYVFNKVLMGQWDLVLNYKF